MSKSSSGLRTISLRIAGTEVAKKELQELGEEVDDFEIRTTSKTDDTIKMLTAVASNNYKGVSVLDSRGNLRSTFDIMSDIADVYNEIQESDKKNGTNRSNALLETLAGKNRANIAASILTNPDTLKRAKLESQNNSLGYADRNMKIYNESLEASEARFKNQAVELASSFMKPEFLTTMTNIGTTVLDFITFITDTFGGISSVLGVGLTALLAKTRMPLLSISGNNSVVSSAGGIIREFVAGFKSAFSTVTFDNADIEKQLSGVTKTYSLSSQLKRLGKRGVTPDADLKAYADANPEATVGDAINQFGNEEFSKDSFLRGLGNIGLDILSGTLTTIVLSLISEVIGLGIGAVSDWIHADEIKVQKGQEAREQISEIAGEYASREQIARGEDSALSRYLELRKGVNYTRGGIENLNLPIEEYEEFLQLNTSIANLFPELVNGFDSQGNAFLSISSDAEAATERLNALLESYRQIAEFEIGEQFSKAATGTHTAIGELGNDLNTLNAELARENSYINFSYVSDRALKGKLDSSDYDTFTDITMEFAQNEVEKAEFVAEMMETLQRAAGEAGNLEYDIINGTDFDRNGNQTVTQRFKLADNITQEQREAFVESLNGLLPDLSEAWPSVDYKAKNTTAERNKVQAQIATEWNNFLATFDDVLSVDEDYLSLERYEGPYKKVVQAIQDNYKEMISSLDPLTDLSEEDWKKLEKKDLSPLKDRYLGAIMSAITDESGEISNDSLRTIKTIMNPSDRKTFNEAWEQNVELATELSGSEAGAMELLTSLGVAVNKGTEGYVSSMTESLEGISKLTNVPLEQLSNMNLKDLKYAQQLLDTSNWDFDPSKYKNTTAELVKYLDAKREEEENLLKDVQQPSKTMKDILEDTSEGNLQSTTDELQELVSAVTEYKKAIKSGEKVDVTDLIQKFPSLSGMVDDFSDMGQILSGLDKVEFTALKKFGEKFKEQISDIYGEENLNQAEQYLQSIFANIDFSALDTDSVRQGIKDLIHESVFGGMEEGFSSEMLAASEREGSLSEQIFGALGTDKESLTLYYSLLLQGQDPLEALENLDAYKLKVDVDVDTTELDKLNNRLETNETRRSLANSIMAQVENRKGYLDSSDYNELIRIDTDDLMTNRRIMEMKGTDRQTAIDKYVASVMAKENTETRAVALSGLSKANNEYLTAQGKYLNAQATFYSDSKEQDEASLNLTKALLAEKKNDTDTLQSVVDRYNARGDIVPQYLADRISEAYKTQSGQTYQEYLDYIDLADKAKNKVDEVSYRTSALESLKTYFSELELVDTSKNISYESQVQELQRNMTTLQEQATEISDEMTLDSGKALNPTLRQYSKLIENGEAQIENLQEQNRLLNRQKVNLLGNKQAYMDNLSQIASNNSAIASMMSNIQGWKDSQRAYYETIGNNLLSALSDSLTQSVSGTGITSEAMKTLVGQFAELEDSDFARIFYNTAEGVKLDTDATKNLVDAQYKLTSSGLLSHIAEEQSALNALKDAYNSASGAEKESIATRIKDSQSVVDSLRNQLAQYQALYAEQARLFSGIAEFERAKETKNAGADYTTMQSYLDTQQKAYKAYETGTDEFKAFTAYFDEWGRTSVTAYQDNYAKMTRYMTDTYQGVKNVYDDLVAAGFGTVENGVYSLDLSNIEKAAHAISVSEEFLSDALGRAEDFGLYNDYVESVVDGQLKLQEATHDWAESVYRGEMLVAQNAPTDVIEENAEETQRYADRMENLSENITDVLEQSNTISATEIQAGIKAIDTIQSRLAETTDEGQIREMQKQIENIAKENHIPLTVDYEADKEKLRSAMDALTETEAPGLRAPRIYDGEGADEKIKRYNEALEKVNATLLDSGSIQEDLTDKLKDYSYEELQAIDYVDGAYNATDSRATEAEKTVDALMSKLELSGESAKEFIDVMQDKGLLGASDIADKTFNVDELDAKIASAGSALQNIFTGTRFEGATNFDASTMSLTELQSKIDELNQMKVELAVDTEGGQEAITELDDLIAACQQEYDVKLSVETIMDSGYSADDFLDLSAAEQKQIMVDIGVDTAQYDAIVAEMESHSIKAKIEAYVEGGGALEDLQDESILMSIGVEGTEEIAEAKAMVEEMAAEEATVTVHINDEQIDSIITAIDSLKNEDADVKVNVQTAELDDVTTKINDIQTSSGDVTINVTVNGWEDVDKLKEFLDTETQSSVEIGVEVSGKESLDEVKEYMTAPHATTASINIAVTNLEQFNALNSYMLSSHNTSATIDVSVNDSGQLQALNTYMTSSHATSAVINVEVVASPQFGTLHNYMATEHTATATISVAVEGATTELAVLSRTIDSLESSKVVEVSVAVSGDTVVLAQVNSTLSNLPESKSVAVDVAVTGDAVAIAQLNQNISQLESKSVEISVAVSDTSAMVESLASLTGDVAINYVMGEQELPVDQHANVYYDRSGQDPAENVTASVYYNRSGQDPAVNVTAGVYYNLSGQAAPQDMQATVYVTYVATNSITTSASVTASASNASGTFSKISAFAEGFGLEDLEHFSALAKGTNVGLPNNQTALINEVGPEGLVRDGVFSVIPGGPHFEKLQKGDIIFSAKQTKDLLSTGSTNTYAKSYATGTYKAPAYASTNTGGSFGGSGYSSVTINNTGSGTVNYGDNSGSGNNYYDDSSSGGGGNNNSSSSSYSGSGSNYGSDSSSGSGSESKTYSYEVFDYITIRLEYFADKTKEIADKITDYVSYATRENLLRKQISAIQDEIQVNSRAATGYMAKAAEIAKSFAYTDDNGNKATVTLTDKFNLNDLVQGKYALTDYDTTDKRQAAYVEAAKTYNEYYKQAVQSNQGIQDLTNSMRELYSQLVKLPTDKLTESLDKLNDKIKTYTSLSDAMSSGESGMRSLRNMFDYLAEISSDPNIIKAGDELDLMNSTTKTAQKSVANAQNTANEITLKASTTTNKLLDSVRNSIVGAAKDDGLSKKLLKYTKNNLNDGDTLKKSKYSGDMKDYAKSWNYILKQTQAGEIINPDKIADGLLQSIQKKVNSYNKQISQSIEANNSTVLAEKAYTDAVAMQKEAQKAYTDAKNSLLTPSAQKVADSSTSEPTWKTQNRVLRSELNQQRKIVDKTLKAYEEAMQDYRDISSSIATNNDALKKKKDVLLNSGLLTAEQIEELNKGNNLNATKVPESLSLAVGEYNKLNTQADTLQSTLTESAKTVNGLREQTSQAAAEFAKTEQDISKKLLDNINAYYDTSVKYYDTLAGKLQAQIDLNLELGRNADENGKLIKNVTSTDYMREIEYMQKKWEALKTSGKMQEGVLDTEVREGRIVKGSKEYEAAMTQIKSIREQARQTQIEIDKLYDTMIADVKLKPFEEAVDQLELLIERVSSLRGLITSDMMYTEDGNFTQLGVASLTMQMQEYKSYQSEITKIQKEMNKLTELYNNGNNDLQLSAEEYQKKMQELQKSQMDALTSEANMRQTIINTVVERYKTELNYINKLIDARKEEIQKQKEMYNYDKNLKSQTKEIQFIEQQIRALETLTDAESKATKARLEAQLKERQETLKDTVVEHVADMRTDALTDLAKQLEDNFQSFVKDLAINIDSDVQLINDISTELVGTLTNTNEVIDNFLKTYNAHLTKDSIGVQDFTEKNTTNIQKKKTMKAAESMEHYNDNLSAGEYEYYESIKTAQTELVNNTKTIADMLKSYNENGTSYMEKIIDGFTTPSYETDTGIFVPIASKTAPIASGVTDELWKIAEASMDRLLSETVYNVPSVNNNNTTTTNNETVIESLITIKVDGNLDPSVVSQIEDIAKQLQSNRGFMDGVYQYTSKAMMKDLRKTR